MPVVGWLFGGFDFSSYFIRLGPIPESYAASPTNYAALKEAGVPLLGYGEFITVTINFLILAFIIFLFVRYANTLLASFHEKDATTAVDPASAVLTREIRNELTAQPGEQSGLIAGGHRVRPPPS